MEDPGEQLVGEYLREVLKCDFIEYNLQTKETQGEIDVVGINSSKKEVFICEVATHLETGLQYTKNTQPDNVDRFVKKFKKNIDYSNKNFKEFSKRFMLWTPIVRIPKRENTKHNQLKDLADIKRIIKRDTNINVETIYNEKYLECIMELRQVASRTTQALTSPIMRFIQIEEKLEKKRIINMKNKILYVDMDNVLVNFQSGIDQFGKEIREEYYNREDEIPGIFGKMKPTKGAIESYIELSKIFDTYILSTSPWENETAMIDKLRWVKKYLGKVAYKRLILSHHKNLNKGDFLIDDRDKNGVKEFEGVHLHFGTPKYPDWESIVKYLRDKG